MEQWEIDLQKQETDRIITASGNIDFTADEIRKLLKDTPRYTPGPKQPIVEVPRNAPPKPEPAQLPVEEVQPAKAPESKPLPEWLEEINKRYAVVNEGKALIIEFKPNGEIERLSFEDFKKLYMNRPGTKRDYTLAEEWLEHPQRRQYLGGVQYAPEVKLSADVLNLWRGFDVTPTPGDWSLLKKHLHEVVCSGVPEYSEYLLNWMARAVQQPGVPGEVAVVMRGDEGVGKGIVCRTMKELFGIHGVAFSNTTHITGRFNGHLQYCSLLFSDEAFFAANRQHESTLKAMITEPSLPVEHKHGKVHAVRNCLHLMMASNLDWVVPAGAGARRFFALEVPSTYKSNHAYFDPIYDQLKNGGKEAMLHELLNRDISKYEVRDVPQTDELAKQKMHSLGGVEKWLYNALSAGTVNRDLVGGSMEWSDTEPVEVVKGWLYNDYVMQHRSLGDHKPEDVTAFWTKIRDILGSGAVKNTRPGGIRKVVLPKLGDARKAFCDYFKVATLDWSEDL